MNAEREQPVRAEREQPVRVGVVGLGYWGPNLARNFAAIAGCELRWLCDSDAAARERLAASFPGARATAELDSLLVDDELDAVVLATPVPTHAELAMRVAQRRQALLRGEAAGDDDGRRRSAPSPRRRRPASC